MGVMVHLHDPFDPLKREVHRLDRSVTVRRLVSRRRELRTHTTVCTVNGRKVREFRRPTVCFLNGKPLLRRQWKRTVVGPTDIVTFYAAPLGGGGSQVLPIILGLALMIAVPYLAPMLLPAFAAIGITGTLAMGLATATVGLALGAVAYGVMSLFAPPAPASQNWQAGYGGTPQTSPTYTLQGSGTQARLGQPVPELFGRHKITPDWVSTPYTRFVDHEQYLHFSLGLSVGEVEIEEERIGDTPIDSYDEIVSEQVAPGGLGDPEIADPRWLVCRDIAEIELQGAADSSPWAGPFVTNVAASRIGTVELDLVCNRGLYKYNSGGGFDTKSVTVEVEGRPIDDDGDPTGDGSWLAFDTVTISGATQQARRVTQTYEVAEGRWEVRCRRTDTEDTAATAGHSVSWVGLRGRLTTERRFAGMTIVNVRMKATGDLNGTSARQYNCIATRKLPTWDPETETMGTALVATRCPCDAYAYIGRAMNAGRFADARIDLAGLYAHKAEFEEKSWTFDFVFDQTVTLGEALSRVARAVQAQCVVQGGKLTLVRDLQGGSPVMMFGPRNIRRGSLEIEYAMISSDTSDSLSATYMDARSWRPVDRIYAFPDSPQENTSAIQLHGVTTLAHAADIAWWYLRQNRYRRRTYRFVTFQEGLCLQYGDPISFSHDLPSYGQTVEVVDWDAGTRIARLSGPLTWTADATHYVAVRTATGTLAGPFEVTQVEDINGVVAEDYLFVAGTGLPDGFPEILTGGDRERTFLQFGPGEAYAKRLKVIGVTPKGEDEVEVRAVVDDARMNEATPDDDEADIGAPQGPIEIHVTEPVLKLNLRSLANANGFTGLSTQTVTIIVDSGAYAWSNDPATAAIVRGSWPIGYRPRLVMDGGFAYGAGGRGGSYTTGASVHGQAGGAALDTRSGPLDYSELGDALKGGGGGGGAGGNSDAFGGPAGGGGGGGGRGYNNAAGGTGYAGFGAVPGNNGTAGSSAAAGTGGTGGTNEVSDGEDPETIEYSVGGDGGDGGGWETAGQAGEAGTNEASPAGSGGAAGAKVLGSVTRFRFGTLAAGIGTIGVTATGKVGRAGVLSSPVGAVTLAATAQLTTHGSLNAPVGTVSIVATGT